MITSLTVKHLTVKIRWAFFLPLSFDAYLSEHFCHKITDMLQYIFIVTFIVNSSVRSDFVW